MRLVCVIKLGSYLPELAKYLVVPRHVGGQYGPDHTLADRLEGLAAEGAEYVAVFVL